MAEEVFMNDEQNQSVVRDFDGAMERNPVTQEVQDVPMQTVAKKTSMVLPVLVAAVILGVGTGYLLFTNSATLSTPKKMVATQQTNTTKEGEKVIVGKVYGSPDASTFKDSAEGVLLAGGINGEGSHRIVRDGGESQTVYLTSSIVDLTMFVNHKVVVKGETFKAQRAGWLMDVGQVKVLELNATLPDWAQKAAEKGELKNGGGN